VRILRRACFVVLLTPAIVSSMVDRDARAAEPQSAKERCEAYSGKIIGGAVLTSAALVPARTIPSATAPIAPLDSNHAGATTVEYCRVNGVLHKTLNFEIRLPTVWNKKLLFQGGGGWNGLIRFREFSRSGLTDGYVVVASDSGHQGNPLDASAISTAEAQIDFGYLASHSVFEVTKQIVRQHYGDLPARSFYEACSNGGREALIQATRFPHDYDGIIARAPAYSQTRIFTAFAAHAKAVYAPGGQIGNAKVSAISKAVLAKCDMLDGLKDGIVSNALACTFDPASLRCTGEDNDACLTEAQVNTARTVYSDVKDEAGRLVYPGYGPGAEDAPSAWPFWVTGTYKNGPMDGGRYVFSREFVRYWITQDPSFDVLNWEPKDYAQQLFLAGETLDASADMTPFFLLGHKAILAHGTNDWAVSYKATERYFADVATAVGGKEVRDASMEFFLEPGVLHCTGGDGADQVDLLESLSKWVEGGVRPSQQNIIARKVDAAGRVEFTRPLCPYPEYSKYKGTGDAKSSDSFTCQKD
jgi:Tannase and feruloyl esterase